MGYDVHITRTSHWTESEQLPITLDEWKACVAADPEMRMDNYAEVATPAGQILRIDAEGIAVWTGYSGYGQDGSLAWFIYRPGRVVVKNPDEEVIAKMKVIAQALNAQIIGDEGELY
jgi:hypothetical protein